jgi:hypothetical protein
MNANKKIVTYNLSQLSCDVSDLGLIQELKIDLNNESIKSNPKINARNYKYPVNFLKKVGKRINEVRQANSKELVVIKSKDNVWNKLKEQINTLNETFDLIIIELKKNEYLSKNKIIDNPKLDTKIGNEVKFGVKYSNHILKIGVGIVHGIQNENTLIKVSKLIKNYQLFVSKIQIGEFYTVSNVLVFNSNVSEIEKQKHQSPSEAFNLLKSTPKIGKTQPDNNELINELYTRCTYKEKSNANDTQDLQDENRKLRLKNNSMKKKIEKLELLVKKYQSIIEGISVLTNDASKINTFKPYYQ